MFLQDYHKKRIDIQTQSGRNDFIEEGVFFFKEILLTLHAPTLADNYQTFYKKVEVQTHW